MLKIHRDSWHYRLWSIGRPSHHNPRNLCRYFWYCVLLVVLGPVIAGLALGGLFGVVYLIVSNPVGFMVGIAIALAIIVAIVGAGYLIARLVERHEAKVARRKERQRRIDMGLEDP